MSIPFFPPRLLVFDLDGTLVDSLPAIVWAANRLRESSGLPPLERDVLARCMHGTTAEFVRNMLAVEATGANRSAEAEADAVRTYAALFRRSLEDGHVRPFEGVERMLDELRGAGRQIAVCTNKPEQLARETLAATGLAERFAAAAVVGSDTCRRAKPHPMPLRRLMRHFRMRVERTWMIGDSSVDLATARAAGCTAVACSYGYGHAETHLPDAVVHQPLDLLALARVPGY